MHVYMPIPFVAESAGVIRKRKKIRERNRLGKNKIKKAEKGRLSPSSCLA